MKRALLVGLDDYSNFNSLGGCINDVHALEPLLARNDDGTVNFNCQVRTAPDAVTRDALIRDVQTLVGPGADVGLLYFAGHGAGEGNDVAVCTYDGTNMTPGVALSQILGYVQASPVREVIVVLDCCFSGAAGGVPQLGSDLAVLRNGVTILAASRADQTSVETAAGRGVFSTYLCGALEGGAADVMGKVTMAGLYAYLDESFGPWDQRPVLRANVDRLHELRRCAAAVPLEHLQRLPNLFTTADYEMPLDPSYEPDADPPHPDHEEIFAVLQVCRAAKLVEPVDAEHMYFAAMQNKACRLTALGRHYRAMAEQGLL
jgi:Caspase domain